MTANPQTSIVRVATAADDEAVFRLFGALHAYNASLDPRFALADDWPRVLAEHLEHVRATGHGAVLLAWEGDKPVGLAMVASHTDSPLFKYRRWAELVAIYVDPDARGGPIARQLLDAVEAWAHEHGHDRVQLYVTTANERARRFYDRAGYRPVQEIWRRELGPADVAPEDDPASTEVYDKHEDLLTPAHHRYAHDDD